MEITKVNKLQAAKDHYVSIMNGSIATIDTYLNNSVGIGEHPQVMEELIKQIDILTNARDNIKTIEKLSDTFKLIVK